MSNIQASLDWMHNMTGKVRYSMDLRHAPGYEDCSSAVFRALQAGGFSIPYVGSTETLFQLRGTLLTTISRADIRAGDVFVSGYPGSSGGSAGHTGFALNSTQAIHCSIRFDGIGISSNADSAVSAYGAPVHWYRVIGSSAPSPDPENPDETEDLILLDKEFVTHDYLESIFGTNVSTEEFENITSEKDLEQKALDMLDAQLDNYQETTLTVLELGLLDDDLDLIDVGNRHAINTEGRLLANGHQRVVRLELDLLNPQTSEVTFGTQYRTLVNYLAERN